MQVMYIRGTYFTESFLGIPKLIYVFAHLPVITANL